MSSGNLISDFERYLRYSGKSDRTIRSYIIHVKRFIDFVGGDVENAGRDDVIRFMSQLESGRGYSERSLNLVGWSLKAFFRFLGKNDIAEWIPAPSYEVVREPEWIRFEDVIKIVYGDPVLMVIYDLALRLSEACLLKRSRYNPETGEIEVYRLKRKGKPASYILKLSSVEPIVPSREALNAYLEMRVDEDDRLFPISQRAIQQRFKKRLKQAGLDPNRYTVHSLRHSRLTHIAMNELEKKGYVDIVSLAKFAGHSRTETTMLYVHLAYKYLAFSKEEKQS